MRIEIPTAWQACLATETNKPYWAQLSDFLHAQTAQGKVIYPPAAQRFAALQALSPQAVKVVILGQDPYHGAGQAHGLSFSVPDGVKPPPSLLNIFKEIARDLGHTPPVHGNLTAWARQGVLLLNTVLTVEAACAASHQKRGWEQFTDAVIKVLAAQNQGIVFMLWGSAAHKKAQWIDPDKHCILQSAHPSPLSAYRGFIGNGHFSSANAFLVKQGREPIDWAL